MIATGTLPTRRKKQGQLIANSGASSEPPPSMASLTAIVHRLENALKPMSKMPEFPAEEFVASIERLEQVIKETGGQRATTAMVKLAESLQSLVQHMRNEQQMLRDWVESQADQQNEIRALLQRLARDQTDAERI